MELEPQVGELKWAQAGTAVDKHLNNNLADSMSTGIVVDMHSKLVLIDHTLGLEIDHTVGFEKGQSIVVGIERTLMDHMVGFEKGHRPPVVAGTERRNPLIAFFNLHFTFLLCTVYI